MTISDVPLSVLDLAVVGHGQTSADALAATTRVAQHAERLGMIRMWVAEHHTMPAVASTSPPVLAAHLAASTTTLRVGAGGVMLPNHPPLAVAEQFAMLEALHPGRIDLGIGRAPGTDPRTAMALRRSAEAMSAEDFPQQLVELLASLGHPCAPFPDAGLPATPAPSSSPEVILLGSSGFSAQLAGELGLPFAFAHHFAGNNTLEAVRLYRDRFRPSTVLEEPYLIITASAILADSDEQALWFARPSQLMMLSLRTGRLGPLDHPEAAAAHPQRNVAAQLPTSQVVGSVATAIPQLQQLVADTGADELMISTVTHGVQERLRSLELLHQGWRARIAA